MFHLRTDIVLKKFIPVLMIAGVMFMAACNSGDDTPDVSGIKVDIKSKRFDVALSKIDTSDLGSDLQKIKNQYIDFADLYFDQVMGFRIQGVYTNDNPGVQFGLKSFLSNPDIRGLFDTVNIHFPDTKGIEKDLTKGFQYMKHYFPTFKVPDITYMISGLNNYGVFLYGENGMAIGLDMFLGDGYPFYRSVGLQDYLKLQLRPEYIPVAAFRNIYQDMYPEVSDDKTLLDMMLQRGKEQYFLSKVLPYKTEATRLAYTQDQLDECNENEAFIYNFFVQKDLLYTTTKERIYPFINDGPVTQEISAACPGNIGTWIGYRIVLAYMQEHPETTLTKLFQTTDSQRFLLESKYKPK
jgi:hypothetical protein